MRTFVQRRMHFDTQNMLIPRYSEPYYEGPTG